MPIKSADNAGIVGIRIFCPGFPRECRPGHRRQVLQNGGVERRGGCVIAFLSYGNLAGTGSRDRVLDQRVLPADAAANSWSAQRIFDVSTLVADARAKEGIVMEIVVSHFRKTQ